MATIYCHDHKFESIRAVLFDKDGTLANVEEYLGKVGMARSQSIPNQPPAFHANLLAAFGLTTSSLDPTGLLAVGSRQENEVAAAAYIAATGTGWIEAQTIAQSAFAQADIALAPKVEQTPLLEGVRSLLSRLSLANIKLGIVSCDLHSEVAKFVEHYDLAEIGWYCGAAQGFPLKTQPGFLSFACKSLSVSPGETLVVGDSASDLMLAKQGAAGFLGMVGGWTRSPTLAPTVRTFSHLSQIRC
ncbi:HAD family hydrolase [cf. Phormidesmis sp. LEGE 11477]|uniref:HAD family hydrolase n=1 Tax=cf. Phormidesmis sp. LEGE 11477 TaxID=1828680 RepID=UPI0018826C22|nr:HAD family hydrolase [cf. Phormidesmis sp. LEGE 11477]MBE9060663.1 HAD family hydrolase [cf. Phormidesmis sp. LEGE 11477]